VPREMTVEDIKTCVEQFRQGAINSMEAGFDGVEVRASGGKVVVFAGACREVPASRGRDMGVHPASKVARRPTGCG